MRRSRLKIIFQATRDGRVTGFLRKKGFEVIELAPGVRHEIGGTTLEVGSVGFYDSFLWVTDGAHSVLNLNDCNISQPDVLDQLRARLGAPDLLLTQFSYAAWKGGKNNRPYRERAAREKLDLLALQARHLEAKTVLPFASFVWFCHDENAYMNEGANTIDSVVARSGEYDSTLLVQRPYDTWSPGDAIDNSASIEFWRTQFAAIETRAPVAENTSHELDALREAFQSYRERVQEKNSMFFVKLARHNPFLRGFVPVIIHLEDLDETVSVSVVDGFTTAPGETPDATMTSANLMLIFKAEFGYDTLMVNGRFEATKEGFSKMTRSLAIGSLNAMGISLGPRALTRPDVFLRLFRLLRTVLSRL